MCVCAALFMWLYVNVRACGHLVMRNGPQVERARGVGGREPAAPLLVRRARRVAAVRRARAPRPAPRARRRPPARRRAAPLQRGRRPRARRRHQRAAPTRHSVTLKYTQRSFIKHF